MGLRYVVDTAAAQAISGRKNFEGAESLQRFGQEAVKTLIIVNRTTTAEPGSPANGQIWLTAATGTITGAAWAASPLNLSNNELVVRSENRWLKITPFTGLELFDASTGLRLERYANAWRDAGGGLGGAPLVTEDNLRDKTHAINISGKYDGRVVKVVNPAFPDIFARWCAHGADDTSPWTPVRDDSGATIIRPV
jgi:hypothetical protein